MFKILDKRNGEVTASQQAVFNKISTNNADGYVDGFLNNLRIAKMSSNVISIDSGLLSIQGFRSVNDTLTTYTVSVTPSEPIPFQLVATYSHYISDENDTLEITTRPVQELRREPLFTGQNAVYEVELAEFNMTADGIADFKVTLEKIVYNEQDLSELLDKVTKAEQDSATALEKVKELETQVIEKQGTVIKYGTEAQNEVVFDSNPQTQITANKSDINDIVSGAQTVGKATNADNATNATHADNADEATKATQDANGNNIADTYAKQTGKYPNLKSGGNTVVDTRSVNSPPSYYEGKETCNEFKSRDTLGLKDYMPNSSYITLTTRKGWEGDYVVYQEAVSAGGDQSSVTDSVKCFRYGKGETWGEWQVVVKTSRWESVLKTDPLKLAPSTSNGWTQTTATGSLPSAGVYMIAFNHLPSGSMPWYYNPAILVYDGTAGSCIVTDSLSGATLVSMVVTPSGIHLTDPVHMTQDVESTNIYYKRIA